MSIQVGIHTSDVALKVKAKTMPNLFKSALRGMNTILKQGFCEKFDHADCVMSVELTAPDRTGLLVDFLSTALALSYVQKAIFCYVCFWEFSENHLVAYLFGSWFTYFDEEIKSVTYHEADIRRNEKGKWETQIIFDI